MDIFGPSALNWVIWIQGLGSWLESPMRFFTFLGSEEFFLLVLPALYWSVDAALGVRVGLILLFSSWLNGLFKLVFAAPRPYWVSAAVRPLAVEASFGIPSGHAQIGVGVWGTLAARLQKWWGWLAAAFLLFLIGLSRVYLGLHFVHDVLAGWLLGSLTLWAFLALWERLEEGVKGLSLARQILVALAASLTFILLGWSAVHALQGYTLPSAWLENARRAAGSLPAPVSLAGFLAPAGTLFGLGSGLAWMARRGGYRASGPAMMRILRYGAGLIGVALLGFGLGLLLPRGDSLLAAVLRYLRYALVGFWVSGGAPWLFLHLKMAGQVAPAPDSASK